MTQKSILSYGVSWRLWASIGVNQALVRVSAVDVIFDITRWR